MKKFLVLVLSAMMVFAMCACGAKEEEQPDAGLPNPVTECTQAELLEATGFDLVAPEGAENVAYSYISAEGEETIAQMIFTVDGKEYCYRAQPTAITSLTRSVAGDENASADSLTEALQNAVGIGAALSGLNYEWEGMATVDVSYCEGVTATNEGKAGFITWLDVAPGILYSLGMNDGCTQDLLINMADAVFVPVQGDAE